MHDSLTPLAGLMPMVGMWLNSVFGGVGVGVINMLIVVIVAVFVAGMMIGRTPELLGRKVEAREMKLASLALLWHPLAILAGTAVACHIWATTASPASTLGWVHNPGPHGFTEMLYEFSSAAANNGSGFEGLGDNTPFWNVSTGLVILLSRYVPIIAPLALAGSLARKPAVPETSGTLRAETRDVRVHALGGGRDSGPPDVHAGRGARPGRRVPGAALSRGARTMLKELRQSVLFTIVTMALFGGVYHAALWALGRLAFPAQAEGSLVRRSDGTVVGSRLVAQAFVRPEYFHPRPSTADYNADPAGASNNSVANPEQVLAERERLVAVVAEDGVPASRVPSELVTASGSGVDPDLSPEAAEIQVARIARARGVAIDRVRALAAAETVPPPFGFYGRARLNVLELNLALDAAFGTPPAASQ